MTRPPITEVTEVTDVAGFDGLRAEWNALVQRMEVPSPFQSWEWNRAWWNHFGTGHELCILVFRDGGRLAGIAQLHRRRYGVAGVGPSVIAPLGWEDHRRKQGLTEQHELIFPAPGRAALAEALAGWLQRHRWSVALLPGNRTPLEMPGWLAGRLVMTGKPVWSYYRDLPATWDEVIAKLGKSMRDNVKYYPRLLERTGHRFRLRVCATPAEVAHALPVFLDLHRARARSELAVAHEDRFRFADRRRFLREVAPLLAGAGMLRIGLLEVDGSVVAAQVWMEMNTRMFIYYTGYDPAWQRNSVQLVATIECLKDGIDRGIDAVEFLRGGGLAKERWDTSRRLLVNVTVARRPALVRLALRVPRVQRDLRLRGATLDPAGAQRTLAR